MQITRMDYPSSPEDPGFWMFELDARLWGDVVRGLFGTDDLSHSALRRWAEGTRPRYSLQVPFVAFEDGTPVGVAFVELPQRDNRHLAFLSIVVAEAHRGRGVGSALYDAAVAEARSEGRDILQCWTWEPDTPRGSRRLTAAEGEGAIDPDGAPARFLLGRGYRLVQVETISGMTLPEQGLLDADAAAARGATMPEYDLVQWSGTTPAEWLDDLAHLMEVMSTDVPMGEAALEPELIDAARVLSHDEALARGGCEWLYTAVRHVPTGRLVGFTRFIYESGRPVVDQWETLIVGDHRGRGLGWFAKTHSHASVRAQWPLAERLITGNASENDYMLAINRRLGYRPIAASGWFELRKRG